MQLSVIVPVYNVEKYIEKCLLSIFNQTFKDMEIIVVNDGSTDTSLEICKRLAETDSRMILIDKKNGGLSDARNCGLEIAKGEYIAFVDSDDWLCEDAFERLLNACVKEDLDIAVGYPLVVYENSERQEHSKKRDIQEQVVTGEEYLVACVRQAAMLWPVQFSLYKRELVKELKFEKGILHEDILWTPQAFLNAKRVKCLNFEFYYYLMREKSITHTANKYKNGCDTVNSCYILEGIYQKVENKAHRAILMDNLLEQFLNGFYIGRLVSNSDRCRVRKNFVFGKAKTKRNIFKAVIFLVNKRMYIWINDFMKKRELSCGG